MNREKQTDDFGFDETIEVRENYVENCRHIKQVGIYPNDLVVLPFEWMTLKISGAKYQQLFEDARKDDPSDPVYLGVGEQPRGEKGLPAVGSVGVAANIKSIDKESLGTTHLVEIYGVVRFRIDEYVETNKPYPVARVTFFQDDPPKSQAEKDLRPQMFKDLYHSMTEFHRLAGKYKHMENISDMMEERFLEEYSFFYWKFVSELTPEMRKFVLKINSTVERTYCLNRQIQRVLERLRKTKPAGLN